MVIVFARAPLPGRVKTRLAPRLGDWGAARLQARLTLNALRTALAARCGPVELHGTPRVTHPFFVACKQRFPIEVKSQVGRDLGERMHRALAGALRRNRAAILMGTDSPALRPQDLQRAARWLRGGCDVVLAPAEDGGYALIAARRVAPGIFEGISWGRGDVYAATVERLLHSGYRWRALRTVWDLDRPEDLARLAARPLILSPGAS